MLLSYENSRYPVLMALVAALLRGVNVGGTGKIKMEALRALCERLGFNGPRTYVQSGNVVFGTARRDLAKLAGELAGAIEGEFGFRPGVVMRTAVEMASVVERNPFVGGEYDPAKLAVVFLDNAPDDAAALGRLKLAGEELHLDGRQLYGYFPMGLGATKITLTVMERALGVRGTARNWNSVRAIHQMMCP